MISVNDTKELIYLGIQGENDARLVSFDFDDWSREFSSGTLELMNRRNGEDMAYLVDLIFYGNSALWVISNKDNAKAGFGTCQLRYKVKDVVVKTATFRTMVDTALDAVDDESDNPYDDVLTEISEKIAEANDLVDEAVDTVSAITNLTVDAEEGENLDVEKQVDPETGEINLHFTLKEGPAGPQGEAGPRGPQGETGLAGPQGETGQRGSLVLRTTANPTSYTDPVGDYTPRYRYSKAAVLSDNPNVSDVIVGDVISRALLFNVVGAVDDTYVYTGGGIDLRGPQGPQGPQGETGPAGPTGPQGPQGDTYTLTAQDKQDIAALVEADLGNADTVAY